MARMKQVAIITGGNSGIGLALAHRFAQWSLNCSKGIDPGSQSLEQLVLVLACRNLKKANAAVEQLLKEYANDRLVVETLPLDTSDLDSVVAAAAELTKRYEYVNYLFCNAGALYIKSLNWKSIAKGIVTHPVKFLGTTEALNQEVGLLSKQGLGMSFTTNFFGHYVLIKKITPLMSKAPLIRRVIWTGSNTSSYGFDKNDIQHVRGNTPYESSKYLTDQISVILDTQVLTKYNIRSIVTEPGNVSTNILSSLDNSTFAFLLYVGFLTIRFIFGVDRLTTTPWNGSYAAFSIGSASNDKLDGTRKYFGCSSRLGKNYVTNLPTNYDQEMAQYLIQEFDQIMEEKSI